MLSLVPSFVMFLWYFHRRISLSFIILLFLNCTICIVAVTSCQAEAVPGGMTSRGPRRLGSRDLTRERASAGGARGRDSGLNLRPSRCAAGSACNLYIFELQKTTAVKPRPFYLFPEEWEADREWESSGTERGRDTPPKGQPEPEIPPFIIYLFIYDFNISPPGRIGGLWPRYSPSSWSYQRSWVLIISNRTYSIPFFVWVSDVSFFLVWLPSFSSSFHVVSDLNFWCDFADVNFHDILFFCIFRSWRY